MKILWFETSQPGRYSDNAMVTRGWQDALENIVRECKEIELFVAFESTANTDIKVLDGVTYIPIKTSYSCWERKRKDWTWDISEKKTVPGALSIIEKVKPDLIHVFGNEWPFGLVAEHTKVPVVIHIQGSIVPYNNAYFPPGYNKWTMHRYAGINPLLHWRLWKEFHRKDSRLALEYRTWKCVCHYMGRTCWDKALVNTLSPNSKYYHVDEALRSNFMNTSKRWALPANTKLRLITTGLSSFWKGPDMLLKTAHILKGLGVDFEWNVAGQIGTSLKHLIEKKENMRFEENNVNILGFTKPEDLIELLCKSTMYVHTAYIENSPNSICEAQFLGLPIISTHVGGIESLLNGGKDGILLPANDPWQMANSIIQLGKDEKRMKMFSENSYAHSHKRHSTENILSDLLNCYHSVLKCQKDY